jgi:hypothetical protein
MPIIFAQHAQCGRYHLETVPLESGRWEWWVKKDNKKEFDFSGEAESLEGAKQNAAMCIGTYPETQAWMPIGKPIQIPD